jgi:hypothetical protein
VRWECAHGSIAHWFLEAKNADDRFFRAELQRFDAIETHRR